MNERREEYHAYLKTPEWGSKRDEALARADHRCQLCNHPENLQVHHRTYERVFNEAPEDLTTLCRPCHERFHDVGQGGGAVGLPSRRPSKKPGKVARTMTYVAKLPLERGRAYSLDDFAALVPSSVCTRSCLAQALRALSQKRGSGFTKISKRMYRRV